MNDGGLCVIRVFLRTQSNNIERTVDALKQGRQFPKGRNRAAFPPVKLIEPRIRQFGLIMNNECNRIAYQLASTINGEAWYGGSLREILTEVTVKQAKAYPIANAHSIWELLSHVEAWVRFAIGAIDGTPIPPWPAMPVELDWPAVSETSERAWKQTVDSFFSQHMKLVEKIKAFTDEGLEATVPGRTYNFYRLFQSTTQHAVYHAGQIALLKKMPLGN